MAGGSGEQTERRKALDLALAQVERQFGKGAIMRMGEAAHQMGVEVIPTGSLALDLALGVGGLPRGRVTEIYGAEASGKTTLALHVVAQVQREGGTAAYLDVEHALDPTYARKLGVNVDELLISQPDYAEQGLEIADYLVRSGAVDVVVVDSVAALVPKAELEGEMGDMHIGLQARLMSQALRKLTGSISRSKTAVIFINQIREKVGVVFGNPEVTSGGRALKFYASVRLDLRRIEAIKQGNDVIGARIRARVVKNKVAPPFRTAEFEILFSQGISKNGDILDLGTTQGILRKNGAFYSFGEKRLGQGREAAREFLNQHPDVADAIEKQIRSAATVVYEVGATARNGAASEQSDSVEAASEAE
ncbi:MAG: recombinase RecA [Dehalococcoidia bacterium]|nr:recombinase RecA [Dehalococcoidia bacterium]